ncbi:MAG: hypothetical protein U1E73_03130 [Planctomycetota bacterium]
MIRSFVFRTVTAACFVAGIANAQGAIVKTSDDQASVRASIEAAIKLLQNEDLSEKDREAALKKLEWAQARLGAEKVAWRVALPGGQQTTPAPEHGKVHELLLKAAHAPQGEEAAAAEKAKTHDEFVRALKTAAEGHALKAKLDADTFEEQVAEIREQAAKSRHHAELLHEEAAQAKARSGQSREQAEVFRAHAVELKEQAEKARQKAEQFREQAEKANQERQMVIERAAEQGESTGAGRRFVVTRDLPVKVQSSSSPQQRRLLLGATTEVEKDDDDDDAEIRAAIKQIRAELKELRAMVLQLQKRMRGESGRRVGVGLAEPVPPTPLATGRRVRAPRAAMPGANATPEPGAAPQPAMPLPARAPRAMTLSVPATPEPAVAPEPPTPAPPVTKWRVRAPRAMVPGMSADPTAPAAVPQPPSAPAAPEAPATIEVTAPPAPAAPRARGRVLRLGGAESAEVIEAPATIEVTAPPTPAAAPKARTRVIRLGGVETTETTGTVETSKVDVK